MKSFSVCCGQGSRCDPCTTDLGSCLTFLLFCLSLVGCLAWFVCLGLRPIFDCYPLAACGHSYCSGAVFVVNV